MTSQGNITGAITSILPSTPKLYPSWIETFGSRTQVSEQGFLLDVLPNSEEGGGGGGFPFPSSFARADLKTQPRGVQGTLDPQTGEGILSFFFLTFRKKFWLKSSCYECAFFICHLML